MAEALDELRSALLDPASLVRAVASGRVPGVTSRWRKVELRPVHIAAGERLQVTTYSDTQAFTHNYEWGDAARAAVNELLDSGIATWTVDCVDRRLKATRGRGDRVKLVVRERSDALVADTGHDRSKERLVPMGSPVLRAVGLTTADGTPKASKHDKLRQIDEFLRQLDAALRDAHLIDGSTDEPLPLRIVDLGCGNAYLTFAAHEYLRSIGVRALVLGVDVKQQAVDHGNRIAEQLGIAQDVTFQRGAIGDVPSAVGGGPADVVMALHACDTASDDAIAAGVRSQASLLLVAPCCHHDVQRQLDAHSPPDPYAALVRSGILRERWGDVLTDALRAELLRLIGYRVEVVEFVGSQHTPRNLLIRAVRASLPSNGNRWDQYDRLVEDWAITPRLLSLLANEVAAARPKG